MPKVSVIMNCRNGEGYVRGAIESVYAQTFTDWEIIFWDNASTDRTAEIARSFDGKLRYFRSPEPTHLGAARNRAMAQAEGEWIGFLDHDDLCLPNRFARQIEAVTGKDYALCYAGIREIDENGRFVRDNLPLHSSGDIFGRLLANCEANLQTTIINADYLKRFKIEMASSFMLLEDQDLFLRLAAKGPVCVIPEILCVWRLLPSSLTVTARDRFAIERFHTLAELRRDNPGIEKRYPEAFREAEARGFYYQAGYEMQTGKFSQARATLKRIRFVRPVYFFLYLVSLWPALWHFVHGRTVKARLTNLLLRRRPKVRRSSLSET
jgi:glycosyltransferase involved in cell wall biosynthesis